jgi:hypothetical protein
MSYWTKVIVFVLCAFVTNVEFLHAYESTLSKNYQVIIESEQNKHKLLHQYHDGILEQTSKSVILNIPLSEVSKLRELGYKVLPVPDKYIRTNKVTKFLNKLKVSNSATTNQNKQTSKQSSLVTEKPPGIEGFSCYSTVEETYEAASQLADSYPDFVQWKSIGQSWDKVNGQGGYDLNVLVLGADAERPNKPKLFIHSAMHAREYTTAALTLDFAKYLANNQNVNADVNWILDEHEIHVLFMMNPDGRKQAEAGLFWRKNASQFYCGVDSDQRGVDLNRNFSFRWNSVEGGSSPEECSPTYRGPEPASEPETQAVEAYVRALFPDNRGDEDTDAAPANTPGLHLDIHSSGGMVIWPWGNTTELAPNAVALQTLGRKFAAFNGYAPFQSVGLYPTDGTSDNVSYGELGIAAITFELGNTFFEECKFYQQEIMPNNLEALLYAAKTVEAPYLKPQGPELVNFRLEGAGSEAVTPGTLVTIKATASDEYFAYNNGRFSRSEEEDPLEVTQLIQKVEYAIGQYPQKEEAVLFALEPVDGAFDSGTEEVSAILDTKSLEEGQYEIYARAQDSDGNWGVMSSSMFTIDADATQPNTPPSAKFSYICQDLMCQFDASDSIDAQGIASYKWHVNGGAPLHGKTVYFPYRYTAEHKVELEVIDTHSFSAKSEQTISVLGVIAPTAVLEYMCEGLVCTFDASKSSDEDGEVVEYYWYIDDLYIEQNPEMKTLEYTFEAMGDHRVVAFIYDNDGEFDYTDDTINVKEPTPAVVPVTAVPEKKSSTGGAVIWLGLLLMFSAPLRKYIRFRRAL